MADARDPGEQPRKVFGAQRAGQAHGLEVVAAAIAADDRDAHLGHDLQQALVDRLLVAREALVQGQPRQQAAAVPVGDRRLGEPGVDRGSADPDQHRDIVHVQALARAHRDRAEAAQALAHQVAVHGTGGQDHRDRRLALRHRLVAQHDLLAALAHRILGRGPDATDRLVQRARPGMGVEGAGDRGGAPAEVLLQRRELAVQQQRALELQDRGLARRLVVDVAEVAVARLEAHHPPFAQRIDRRVGDLGELLTEEVVQAAIARREHRGRRVVAHGADRLLGVDHHRHQQKLEILDRDAVEVLPPAQLGTLELGGLERPPRHQVAKMGDVLHPLAIRLLAGEQVLQLAVVVEFAGPQVDADHAARADPALLDDPRLLERHHADLGAQHHQAVGRARIAHRPQAVAVHAADHPVAVGRDQPGRPVPRLHDAVAVAEQVLMALGDRHLVRPGRRDQQGLDERQGAAGAHQGLDDGIERCAVGAAGLDERLDLLVVRAEGGRHHAGLVALHPVEVAAQRVDLAVVGEHPERLGEPPGWPGVGRVALVEDREGWRRSARRSGPDRTRRAARPGTGPCRSPSGTRSSRCRSRGCARRARGARSGGGSGTARARTRRRSAPFGLPITICSISGRVAIAFSPITEVSTGTWRQPRML